MASPLSVYLCVATVKSVESVSILIWVVGIELHHDSYHGSCNRGLKCSEVYL